MSSLIDTIITLTTRKRREREEKTPKPIVVEVTGGNDRPKDFTPSCGNVTTSFIEAGRENDGKIPDKIWVCGIGFVERERWMKGRDRV